MANILSLSVTALLLTEGSGILIEMAMCCVMACAFLVLYFLLASLVLFLFSSHLLVKMISTLRLSTPWAPAVLGRIASTFGAQLRSCTSAAATVTMKRPPPPPPPVGTTAQPSKPRLSDP